MNKLKKEIEAKYSNPIDKLEAAYKAIKKVKWNGFVTAYSATSNLSTPFKEGKANSAEINMMLMQLLLKLDFNTLPVVLSTRSNGMLHRFYPSYDKLNYMLVWTKVDDEEYILDATDKYLPLGMLPKRCLNGYGRLVTNESGKWIDLNTKLKDREVIMYQLKLDDNMNLQGKVESLHYGYNAYNFRKSFSDYASNEEYLKSIEEANPGLTIKDGQIENVDDLVLPVKDKFEVTIKNKVEVINDMALINPFIFEQLKDNPFKLENRQYPVDFAYKRDKYVITNITIPDDYQVEELPKRINAVLPDKTASLLINFKAIGNKINVTYRLKLNKVVYSKEEYALLRQLYATIINKQAEPIVIKKTQNEASL